MIHLQFLLCALTAQLPPLLSYAEGKVFTPYDFHGKGDAKANDTLAVQQALDAAADSGAGTVWIPANGTFLLGAGLRAIGPRYNGVTLQLDGTLQVVSPPVKWAPCKPITPGKCAGAVLDVYNVDGLTLTSKVNGKIQGFLFDEHRPPTPPSGPSFFNSSNLLIEGISIKHMIGSAWIHNCQNVTWRNVFAYNRGNPEESGNLEVGGIGSHGTPFGTDMSKWQYEVPLMHATNITIRDSEFNGGDDNICIKNDTSNVLVENCTVGDGHGVTIGSTPDCNGCYGYNENLTFRGIRLHGNAPLKIKTWPNTTGVIKNVLFEDVTLLNGADTLVAISAWYSTCTWCHEWFKPTTTCRQIPGFGTWGGVCAQTDQNLALENITLRGIRGKVINAGSILCREPLPCTINLEDVHLEAQHGWDCANAKLQTRGTNVTPALPVCRVGPHVPPMTDFV